MSLKNNPTLKSTKIKVGLTIGDPAGIGPAITLKALKILKDKVDLTVIGDGFVLDKAAQLLKIKPFSYKLIDLQNISKKNFKFGQINSANGQASLEYLDRALKLLRENKINCLVTCPVSKEAISLTGKKFFGHTEYLAQKTRSKDPVMLLLNRRLKFSLATRHIPLQDVSTKLTQKNLEENILKTIQGLQKQFLIKQPKIVLCGINPHASDHGLIGAQEKKVMLPVVKKLKKIIKPARLSGPLPADVAIAELASGSFDCAVAAYHDQALIALKLTDFKSGVNLTIGLPFVRSSPLHGTAFDLAAHPELANPHSLVAAIELALKCRSNQKKA